MKQASNSFTKGMVLDTHPLTTQNTLITDALNATLVTFNGNEMMLQNDMGNTLILDSATGNIMGLNPGFIPIGLKEHGGIMYIASVNKEGKGEIGTIPSPIIRDFYKEKNTYNVNKEIPLGETPIQISNKFYPADKFIVNLDMEIDEDSFKDTHMRLIKNDESTNPADWLIVRYVWKINNSLSGQGSTAGIETPIISYNSRNQTENLFSDKGIYKLNLYAKNNSLVKASDNLTSALGNGENHWFYHNSKYTFPKDLMEASLSGILKQFPSNSKPGYLAVGLELESIGSFSALPRTDEPLMVPYIYKNSSNTHYAYFPGFKYTTDCGLYINTLKNIKVIDEQADKSVKIQAYTQSSKFTDSIDELIIDGNRMPNKEPDDSLTPSDFWCPAGFYHFEPQLISQLCISDNEFYISPIVWSAINQNQLKSHSYTDIIQSYPRLGLFCADLGDRFNNWYRLELDYYDQFDGYQGHFELRFNPYLNDVFGTNLSTNGIEIANSLKMGDTQRISVDLAFKTETKDVPIKWATGSISLSNPWPTLEHTEDFKLAEIIPVEATQITYYGYDELAKYLYAPLNIQLSEIDQTQIYWNEAQFKVENLQLYPQWYGNLNGVKKWHNVGKQGGELPSAFYLCNEDGDINTGWDFQYEYSNNQGTIVFRTFTMFNNSTTHFGYASNDDLNSWILTSYKGEQEFTKSKNLNSSVSVTLVPYGQDDDVVAVRHSNVSGTFPTLYRRGTSTPVWQDALLGGNLGHRSHWCWAGERRFVILGTIKDFEFNGSVSMDHLVNPIYSITPYFLLKGTNDNGNSVYVSRFGQGGNTTLTYECNFELDSDGIPHNYLDLSNMPEKQTYTSSYNSYIKNLSRYLYNVHDQDSGTIQSLRTGSAVQPGIYVLNMTLCPGCSNWIKSGSNPIIDLNIIMNGKTYSDITINSYWRMYSDILKFELDGTTMLFSPLYITDVEGKPANNIGALTYPYNPLVLIVRNPSVILLEFIKKRKNHNFEFLEIGLYRVNSDVPLEKLYELISRFTSDIYMYQDYMSAIAILAAAQSTPAKQYSFTLRYGAFFREAYVFAEGIYNSKSTALNDGKNHPVIESITVGEKTYYSIPYIPSEPYVLPVMLEVDSKNKVTYSWNTYFMSKIGADPGFLITNNDGLPDSIKSQDNLNSLRTTNNS